MSPVHIDECDPQTRAKVRQQIGETAGGTTALATVEELSSLTLGDPANMTNDQLADTVIDGVKKLRHYLPYIIALKTRFDGGQRDSTNRLRKPIKDCYSWKEFCENHLDRTPRALTKALATPQPTPAAHEESARPSQAEYTPADAVVAVTTFVDKLVRTMSPQDAQTVYQQLTAGLPNVVVTPMPAPESQPAPAPAEAPLTVKELVAWHESLDTGDGFNIHPRKAPCAGHVDLNFCALKPAVAKKLAEYFVSLAVPAFDLGSAPDPETSAKVEKPDPMGPVVMHRTRGDSTNVRARTWCGETGYTRLSKRHPQTTSISRKDTSCVTCLAAIGEYNQ